MRRPARPSLLILAVDEPAGLVRVDDDMPVLPFRTDDGEELP